MDKKSVQVQHSTSCSLQTLPNAFYSKNLNRAKKGTTRVAGLRTFHGHRLSLDLMNRNNCRLGRSPKPITHMSMPPKSSTYVRDLPKDLTSKAHEFSLQTQAPASFKPSEYQTHGKELALFPVLRLCKIESHELVTVKDDLSSYEVLSLLQSQRKTTLYSEKFLASISPKSSISTATMKRRYSDETATVLGCTKTLAVKRLQGMKIAARLAKSVRVEDIRRF